jgi:hypothetical protein
MLYRKIIYSDALLRFRRTGMDLHICRGRFSLDGVGMFLFFFFNRGLWQGKKFVPTFSIFYGYGCCLESRNAISDVYELWVY